MTDESTTKRYDALIFRQQARSPIQVAFVASSAEIDQWAGVPTKKTSNIRNFQRPEIGSHIKEVTRFFGDSENASPTAVVVGFDSRNFGNLPRRVAILDIEGEPLDGDAITPGPPVKGLIEITWPKDNDPKSQEDFMAAIISLYPHIESLVLQELSFITGRSVEILNQIRTDISPDSVANTIDSTIQEIELQASIEVSEGEEDNETIDLSDSVLSALAGLSPNEVQNTVNRLGFLNRLSSVSINPLDEQSVELLYREAHNELKPALLIDGQHRVMGTKDQAAIPFLVTALPQADWSELAFQFIVTNRTARRVPESLLISIVGNSLSKTQRGEIDERLRNANIRVGLIEAVMKVQEDESSPFYGLVAFGLRGEQGFLDAAAMRSKVIQLWFDRKEPIRTLFDHLCQGRLLSDRTEFWKEEELWFDLFIAFWSGVRSRYDGTTVFSKELRDNKPVSKLMTATVLKIFQETVLEHIKETLVAFQKMGGDELGSVIPNPAKFQDLVTKTLANITPDFFTEWGLSGFDGSSGARDDLAQAIKLVLEDKMTVSQLKNPRSPHRLFKGKS
ncbi:hypothetical protein [Cyanobium sp. N5-Cardenillas]|uniref:hypothetical protein n=1 Tax=Cyanobium sp. N5-Cardenillas TaxID=2823720 RepID=UPI0020CCA2B1|nr:hypothetical protein [Cyanobium sp. N5-Cardenillas]MCP9784949.1 hypothetical protein [Cyanobium sp. N5-Cardenillas]